MTILEIAKMAGVSRAAVSRYFNNGYISEEKREAIRKVVEETGYHPSAHAQMLRTKKTKMIGVIIPKVASTSIGRVVEGILSVLNEAGYQMLLAVTQNNPQKELEYLVSLNKQQVDGIIFVATVVTAEHKRRLKNLLVPVVVVGQKISGYSCVYHDDYHATYKLTERLISRGRKKPAYIGALMQDNAVGQERYRGYCDALCEAGLQRFTENYVIADFTIESGYQVTEQLLKKCKNEIDTLLCATDIMAAGALKYLKEHGIKVPQEVLVAGHDDSDIARITSPPLMTVHFFHEKSGKLAARMMLDFIHNNEQSVQEIKLGYYLIDNEGECIENAG